jgi:uncharacterized protein (TIGR03032 family)
MSTYQAGKLVVLRANKEGLNTHFVHDNKKPMGMYANKDRFFLGNGFELTEYINVPNMNQKIQDGNEYDACYMVKNRYVTGDIDIHEIEVIDDVIYAVNSKFSHISIIDNKNSFTPYWKPPFITEITYEDKCHLNGMCFKDGKLSHATALGESDTASSWRENKLNGGVLIDIQKDEVIKRGLSMPHSPCWHQGELYLCESGYGRLCRYDVETNEMETIVELPGFTRGLAFYKDFAFVALSKVRDSALFIGLPITKDHESIQSGISIIDIKNKKEIAFLRFEDNGVNEIFDVVILPHRFATILEKDDELHKIAYTVPPNFYQNLTRG